MSSNIHYKFRSAKEYDSYRFEGSGIPVWQLKTEIIESKKLEKSNDFELMITNAQTNADYTDDMQIIPRNTSVVVRRVPVAPGTAKNYNPARETRAINIRSMSSNNLTTSSAVATGPLSAEDADIQSVIQQSSLKFEQQATANATSALQPGRRQMMTFRPKPTAPSLPPPPNYVCFRCGQKGHFINHCPTNADPNFDKPRIKKTTGIPKSFLKPVEGGDAVQARAADPTLNVMITAEGEAVIARPNEDEWKRLVDSKSLSEQQDDPRLAQLPSELSCANEHLLINPVLLPCCGAPYCEGCARLLRVCCRCESSFDHAKLQIDTDLKLKVEAYMNGVEPDDTKSQVSKADSAPINVESRNEHVSPRMDHSERYNRDQRERHSSHDYPHRRHDHRDYRDHHHGRDMHYKRKSRSRSRDRRRSHRSRSRSPSYEYRRSYRRSRH